MILFDGILCFFLASAFLEAKSKEILASKAGNVRYLASKAGQPPSLLNLDAPLSTDTRALLYSTRIKRCMAVSFVLRACSCLR